MTQEDLRDKKIAVLGIGVEGEALITYLQKQGCAITIFDEKEEGKQEKEALEKIRAHSLPVFFGKENLSKLSDFDIIFRSPGIRHDREALKEARKNGVTVTSQTQLFFDLCPCEIIGVTGTKGKGTTSSLIYEILKTEGFDAFLGGNIGTPPISFLASLSKKSKVVLEMSSFQLHDLHSSPHISVMLMTTSEHLDYHTDVYEYIDAKRNIFRFQKPSDIAVVNKDYPASNESDVESDGTVYKVSRNQEVMEGCYVKDGSIVLKTNGEEKKVIDTKDILLPGAHNLENVCAAVLAAVLSGATIKSAAKVLKTFKGLEHRLELVRTVKGVKYYDDSFSTTPETAIAAIEAFESPEILILGGSSKNSDFTALGSTINASSNIKAIIGIGIEWERIKEHIHNHHIQIIEGCSNMLEVVKKASQIASLGDVVLLSPACASFGMFKNYKDRGSQFKTEVNAL